MLLRSAASQVDCGVANLLAIGRMIVYKSADGVSMILTRKALTYYLKRKRVR